MSNKVYVVEYYVSYSTHGIHGIFKNKEDAVRCAKIMTEKEANVGCQYDIYEEVIYSSFEEWEVR